MKWAASVVAMVMGVASPGSSWATPPPKVGVVLVESTARVGLRPEVLSATVRAHRHAVQQGDVDGSIVTVIDYSRPSSEKRLWVLDLATGEVLFHEWVAHGSGSGAALATDFSNVNGSRMTSLGAYRTGSTYAGKHGRSLYLDGLEAEWNGNARERAIVVHGADYVSQAMIDEYGRVGRSWGCPAVRTGVAGRLIDVIRDGTLLVAYADDERWLSRSEYVRDR